MPLNQNSSGSDSPRKVLFCSATNRVVDVLTEEGHGKYLYQSLQDAQAQNPQIVMLEMDEANSRETASMVTPVEEISRTQFDEALCVLPPMDWQCATYTESFKSSEFYSGEVTQIYARIGCGVPRYFRFRDSYKTQHPAIVRKVNDFIGMKQSAPLALGLSTVCVVDPGLVSAMRGYDRFKEWAAKAASYRPVNGSRMSMVNPGLDDSLVLTAHTVGGEVTKDLVAIDPTYLVVMDDHCDVPSVTALVSVDLTDDVLPYEQPREVIEWRWIEMYACMAHVENGSAQGVWDLVVPVSAGAVDTCPIAVKEHLVNAQLLGASFVLFHQGT